MARSKPTLEQKLAAAIASPKGVTSLDLRGTKTEKLSSLPSSIGALKDLRVLLLDHNELTTLPQEFEKLKALEYLSIARNQLTDMRPACYLKKLRLFNVHGNQLENSYVGQHQKDLEVHLAGNKRLANLGWFRATHMLGIDTDSLYPLNASRYEKPWKSVKLIQLYGRDLVPLDRNNVSKYFPNAQLKWMGYATQPSRPKIATPIPVR